jgi:DNA-binding NarL/FixJ family response regulator
MGLATWCAVVASGSIGRVRPTVLIVDDHAEFRASARALLEAEGFEVVGEAATGHEAVIDVERMRPNVVLLDIRLPDQDGFAVAERLAAGPAAPAIVLTSSHEASAYGPRIARASVRGFIPKRALSGAALAGLVG